MCTCGLCGCGLCSCGLCSCGPCSYGLCSCGLYTGLVQEWGGNTFTVLFTLEALLKIAGMGPIGYLKSPMNVADFLIVLASLVEMLFEFGPGLVIALLRVTRVFLKILRATRTLSDLYIYGLYSYGLYSYGQTGMLSDAKWAKTLRTIMSCTIHSVASLAERVPPISRSMPTGERPRPLADLDGT